MIPSWARVVPFGSHLRAAFWSILLAIFVAGCGSVQPSQDAELERGTLLIATGSGDAMGIEELAGRTVSGTVSIVVDVNKNVNEIHFFVDGAAAPLAITRVRPFQLSLDTTTLVDGAHSISAQAPAGRSGTLKLVAEAEFFVANGVARQPEQAPPREIVEGAYFVAPWGSDSAAGTFDSPWASLRPLEKKVGPGDTVYLRGGVYDEVGKNVYQGPIQFSGTAHRPITVMSYPGERAIFDGSKHPHHPRTFGDGYSVSGPNIIRFYGEHVVWESITIRYGVGRAFFITANHSVFRDIVSHDNHSDGLYLEGSHNLFEYVESFNNYSVANGGNSADGMKMVDGDRVRLVFGSGAETRGNVIRYALFYNNSDDGLDVWNSWDTLVEYSLAFGNGYGPTGNGMGYKLGGASRHGIGTVARFNVAFGNVSNFDSNGSTGVTMHHNTSWNAREFGFILRDQSETGGNVAHNNISFQDPFPVSDNHLTVQSHNSWNVGIDDPKFVTLDPSSPDFLMLASGSPAVGAGRDLGKGRAPDLGAVQREGWRGQSAASAQAP
jgi:hypothetical protein